jgi:hypothetical protein
MDITALVMWVGFCLSAYAVVGNDVIQTLGTFLSSNEDRVSWQGLWFFTMSLMTIVLVFGWFDPFNEYDYKRGIAYGRLDDFYMPEQLSWYYILPPIILIFLTRRGIPVSTTFMILILFSLNEAPDTPKELLLSLFDKEAMLGEMLLKSILGYFIAFFVAALFFVSFTRVTEKYFMEHSPESISKNIWTLVQWGTTGFLWYQWLIQDLANIYIYLKGGDGQSPVVFVTSWLILLILLAFVFKNKGGAIQKVVLTKTNTKDIRAATFIDLIFGATLYLFRDNYLGLWSATVPMSTTWVFVGLLGGREIAMQLNLKMRVDKDIVIMVLLDFAKILLGLVVSIILVIIIKLMMVRG